MPEKVRLVLSKDADIRPIGASKSEIMQKIDDGKDLLLDLSAVEEADLTLIQLILSARRSAADRNLSLLLTESAPEPVLRMLERGGFIGPAPDTRRDFWLAA